MADLYDAHGTSVYAYALSLLDNVADAEDVVQDVFLKVAALTRSPAEPRRYLLRAARNEAYSRLRRRRLWFLKGRPAVEEKTRLLECSANGSANGSAVERDEMEAALRALPPKQREVVVLKVFEGLSFQEIAGILDVSANTAASRYRYAIEKLRDVFGRGDDVK